MQKKLVVTLGLALGLGLVVSLAVVLAQGPGRESGEEGVAAEQCSLEGSGLGDAPSPGFTVLYMFTGVANDSTGEDQIATSVHCTNFGLTAVTVEVQFFQSGGGSALASPFTDILSAHETGTYSTQATLFTEFPLNTAGIEQGSGRVLVKEHTQVICTAQLLQPGAITPTFMAKLPMFDSHGELVGRVRQIFLPVIFKP